MSDTWTVSRYKVDSESGGEWCVESGPVGPRYTHYFRNGVRVAFRQASGLPFGFLAADGSLDEANALRCLEYWSAGWSNYVYSLDPNSLVSTSTPAGRNSSVQTANGQKGNTTPMKFTVKTATLATAIQKSIDTLKNSVAEQQAKFDAETATAKAIVDANLASLAADAGLKDVPNGPTAAEAFKATQGYNYAITNVKHSIGLNTQKPLPLNTKGMEGDLALVNSMAQDSIELDEAHSFVSYLRG